MTIEEAIKHCEEVAAGKTEQGKCPECAADHKQLGEWLREIVILRAQQTPLDRSRWEGCEWCNNRKCVTCHFFGRGKMKPCCNCHPRKEKRMYKPAAYCCVCGRPLTEGAWEEMERRLE